MTIPPRHGKSLLADVWFPVWYLTHFPDHSIMLAAHGIDFAEGWGRKVRNLITEHRELLGVSVTEDSAAAGRWNTPQGGGMIATGAGGSITGRGANVMLIDDPVKDAEAAYSPGARDKLWQWYTDTAYDRLEPGGSIVLTMHRWHPDDIVGRLIAEQAQGGDRWELINLPALAMKNDPLGRAEGEALWTQRYDVDALNRIRSVGPFMFGAKYQQQPQERSGAVFRREWFKITEHPPQTFDRIVRFWDLAATEQKAGRNPDWTVGSKVGVKGDTAWLLHVRRLRGSPDAVESAVVQEAKLDGRGVGIRMEEEGGASGKSLVNHFAKLLRGFDFRGIRAVGDKVTRAMPCAAACERGEIQLVNGPWIREFLDELATFPGGDHDDQVDTFVGAWDAAHKRTWLGNSTDAVVGVVGG